LSLCLSLSVSLSFPGPYLHPHSVHITVPWKTLPVAHFLTCPLLWVQVCLNVGCPEILGTSLRRWGQWGSRPGRQEDRRPSLRSGAVHHCGRQGSILCRLCWKAIYLVPSGYPAVKEEWGHRCPSGSAPAGFLQLSVSGSPHPWGSCICSWETWRCRKFPIPRDTYVYTLPSPHTLRDTCVFLSLHAFLNRIVMSIFDNGIFLLYMCFVIYRLILGENVYFSNSPMVINTAVVYLFHCYIVFHNMHLCTNLSSWSLMKIWDF
jgi:hypothetical protein